MGERICQGPGCKTDISHLHALTRYCNINRDGACLNAAAVKRAIERNGEPYTRPSKQPIAAKPITKQKTGYVFIGGMAYAPVRILPMYLGRRLSASRELPATTNRNG